MSYSEDQLDEAYQDVRAAYGTICKTIEAHAERIYVREQIDGKWGSHALTDLPADRAIHHALRFVREGRMPIYLREDDDDESD